MICGSLMAIRPLLAKCFPSLFPATTNGLKNHLSNSSWGQKSDSRLGTSLCSRNNDVKEQDKEKLGDQTSNEKICKTTQFGATEILVVGSSDAESETKAATP
jgi:hypothetical protein